MRRSTTEVWWNKYSKQCDARREKQLRACYEAGRLAQREGHTLENNPFGSHAWRAMWVRGFQKESETR